MVRRPVTATTSNKPERVVRVLGAFIELLEREAELVRVSDPVDPRNFELSSIVQHMENGPNQAVLFENVKGYDMPVVANLYGSVHRVALAPGVAPTPEQVEAKLGILATRTIDENHEAPAPEKVVMDRMRPIDEKYLK
jgi:UbiD family decarboxylase